jgi:hypothetical protein
MKRTIKVQNFEERNDIFMAKKEDKSTASAAILSKILGNYKQTKPNVTRVVGRVDTPKSSSA